MHAGARTKTIGKMPDILPLDTATEWSQPIVKETIHEHKINAQTYRHANTQTWKGYHTGSQADR